MKQREIFEQAYLELSDALFRYIYFRVFDRDVARDLTQETFFRIWDYLAKGKEIENMKAFAYQTARNIISNSIRAKHPTVSLEDLEELNGFEVADTQQQETAEQEQDIASVLDSFRILKEKDAELLRLRYVDGLSIQEIAEITSSSENSISVKIHRLLEKLRNYHSTQ